MSKKTEQQQEEWIPWSEGAEILGIKRSAFFHLIETGQIRVQPGTPPRKGRYSLEDIMANKRSREQRQPRKPYRKRPAEPVIDWLRIPDVPATLDLNYEIIHDFLLDEAKQYLAWNEKNPFIVKAAFDPNDRKICLGYLYLIPLPEPTIFDILGGKSIKPKEIETYERSGRYALLAHRVVVRPDRAEELLFHLASAMADFWIDQFPDRYARKVYAQSTNRECDYAIQLLHMAPRYDLGANIFELDLARPGVTKPVQDFQNRLKEKGPLPQDLQWQH